MINRARLIPILFITLLAILLISFWLWKSQLQPTVHTPGMLESPPLAASVPASPSANSQTRIHAHNLLLRKGPDFRIYVRWLDGFLARTNRAVSPSFDRPESFVLNIDTGVIRVNIGDIGHFINSSITDSPLKDVTLLADGSNLRMTGTVHKLVPLSVQVIASVSVAPDNRVLIHISKIDVLKLPVKGMLKLFHISTADLVKNRMDGLEVRGDDLLLDTSKLLPPPHIRGTLRQLSVDGPDLQAVYGKAEDDVERAEMWRNFFSMDGGTVDFGSLSMHPVKIMLIDISSNPWFDLDLVNYRAQFASGYTRLTSDSALQMFIPDIRDIHPNRAPENDSIQWFKDRNIPPPSQIVVSTKH